MILVYILSLWFVVDLLETARRLSNGATLRVLAADAFEEVVPVRWFLRSSVALLWAVVVGAGILTLRGGWAVVHSYQLSGSFSYGLLLWVFLPLAVGLFSYWLNAKLKSWLDEADGASKPVDVSIRSMTEGIDVDRILDLGLERYPNRVDLVGQRIVVSRVLLLVLLALLAIICAGSALEEGWEFFLRVEYGLEALAEFYRDFLPSEFGLPQFADFLVPYASLMLLGLFTFTNRHYLYFRFQTAVLVYLLCMLGAGFMLAPEMNAGGRAFCCLLILLWPIWRLILDLALLKKYRRRCDRLDPASEKLAEIFGEDLSSLAHKSKSAYPTIDAKELDKRLDDGATKVGRDEFMVPPRFGRYMQNAEVEWCRAAAAVGRFMTIARSIQLVNQRSTSEGLRDPKVPAWDEELFPINVPKGYVTWDNAILLGPEWRVVRNCGTCGGSGRERCYSCYGSGRVTKSETVYRNGRSTTIQRQVTCQTCGGRGRIVCRTCSGRGRLMFDQQLTTSWRTEAVASPFPKMHMHELVENAVEFDFAKLRVFEDRQILVKESVQFEKAADDFPAGLEAKMQKTRQHFKVWSSAVEHLEGGQIYRAELALSGLHIIRATFGGLFQREGWFLGTSPEFHFPRLPIGWATIGAFLTVPLLVGMISITLLIAVAGVWTGAEHAAITAAEQFSPGKDSIEKPKGSSSHGEQLAE